MVCPINCGGTPPRPPVCRLNVSNTYAAVSGGFAGRSLLPQGFGGLCVVALFTPFFLFALYIFLNTFFFFLREIPTPAVFSNFDPQPYAAKAYPPASAFTRIRGPKPDFCEVSFSPAVPYPSRLVPPDASTNEAVPPQRFFPEGEPFPRTSPPLMLNLGDVTKDPLDVLLEEVSSKCPPFSTTPLCKN